MPKPEAHSGRVKERASQPIIDVEDFVLVDRDDHVGATRLMDTGHRARIYGPAPSDYMTHRDMVNLVGKDVAMDASKRGTTLMVPSSRETVGGAVSITNMDAWRWNRWNKRWERQGGAKQIGEPE